MDKVIIKVYVDNLFILTVYGIIFTIKWFKSDFRKLFKIKDLELVSQILNI